MRLLLLILLLAFFWPMGLVVLALFPLVWLLLLPLRLAGIVVGGVLELVAAVFLLPVRLVRSIG